MTSVTLENIDYKAEIKKKTSKPLLWIGIVSIVMFFSGLTSAVIVIKSDTTWDGFSFPPMFLWSTIIIVCSSLLFHIGLNSVKNDKIGLSKITFIGTLVLGLAFGITQYYAWTQLYANGVFFSGSNAVHSFLYVLTGLHFAHMLGGLISLIVVITKSVKEKYSSTNYLGIQLSITYWHFLGVLWVYLFFFLKYIA